MEDPSEKKKRRRRERFKQRYADEPEFREKEKAKCRAYRRKKAEINARPRKMRRNNHTECRWRNTPRGWLDRAAFASFA